MAKRTVSDTHRDFNPKKLDVSWNTNPNGVTEVWIDSDSDEDDPRVVAF